MFQVRQTIQHIKFFPLEYLVCRCFGTLRERSCACIYNFSSINWKAKKTQQKQTNKKRKHTSLHIKILILCTSHMRVFKLCWTRLWILKVASHINFNTVWKIHFSNLLIGLLYLQTFSTEEKSTVHQSRRNRLCPGIGDDKTFNFLIHLH